MDQESRPASDRSALRVWSRFKFACIFLAATSAIAGNGSYGVNRDTTFKKRNQDTPGVGSADSGKALSGGSVFQESMEAPVSGLKLKGEDSISALNLGVEAPVSGLKLKREDSPSALNLGVEAPRLGLNLEIDSAIRGPANFDSGSAPFEDSPVRDAKLLAKIKTWSLEERAGQLLMVGFRSFEQIKKVRPGGVVLFSWSLQDIDQTRKLISTVKSYASKNLKSPLFVAIDHEGGKVLRLRKGMTFFPDAAAVGAIRDPEMAFKFGEAMGLELASLGIHMNFAPVLDLGNARSFLENRVWGNDPSDSCRTHPGLY